MNMMPMALVISDYYINTHLNHQ